MRYQALPTQALPTQALSTHTLSALIKSNQFQLFLVSAFQVSLAAVCVYILSRYLEAQLSLVVLLIYPITTVIFAFDELVQVRYAALFNYEKPSTIKQPLPVHKVLLILSTQIMCLTVFLRYVLHNRSRHALA